MFTVVCHLVFKKAAPAVHHAVKHYIWRPVRKSVKHAVVHKKILATATLVCTVSGSAPYLSPAPAALPPLPPLIPLAALPQPLLGGGGFLGGFIPSGFPGELSESTGPVFNAPIAIGELPNIDFLKDFTPSINVNDITNIMNEVPVITSSNDVPEPETFGLVLLGILATIALRRKCSF